MVAKWQPREHNGPMPALHRGARGRAASLALLVGLASSAAILSPILAACSGGDAASTTLDDAASDPPSANEGGAEPWTFDVLETRTVRANDQDVPVELVAATRPDGVKSYLLYVHAAAAGAPVVIANEPYAGIDWTGEEVDRRWAAQGDGLHPDVDAPNYDGDDVTSYGAQTVQKAVEGDVVWRIDGFAVVHAYGRFYAGGDVRGDALDAAAGYHFVKARKSELDATRIGAMGGSWGGMMTLFGAAEAPSEAPPKALAALTPLSDFVDEYAFTEVDLPKVYPAPAKVEAFFSPYWRRAAPSMGAPPEPGERSRPYTHAGLCPKLAGRVFVAHDDWDTLIPIRQSESLARDCGGAIEPLFWRRGPIDYASAPLDHGALNSEEGMPTIFTFAWSFLGTALQKPGATIYTAGDRRALIAFLTLVKDARAAGRDAGMVVERLRELADARVTMFESEGNTFVPAADVLALAVNEVWGTSFDAGALRAQLIEGLPAAR